MPKFNYIYCQENKDDLHKSFNIPQNENAPEHLKMTAKPVVYAIEKLSLKELLTLCAVPIIDPIILATIFIRFWPESHVMDEKWESFGIQITRSVQNRFEVTLQDLFRVKHVAQPKAE